MFVRPQNIQLKGTIYDTKPEKYQGLWLKGGFNLYLPEYRWGGTLGVIQVPEDTIEFSELMERVQDFYEQPISMDFLENIIYRDPQAAVYLKDYIQALERGRKLTIADLMGGSIYPEIIEPIARGDYRLFLG
jgi:hypothetical protein